MSELRPPGSLSSKEFESHSDGKNTVMAYRTVGYYENWAQYRQAGGKFFPSQINPSLFTHINFAFGLFGFVSWSVDPTPARTGEQRYTGDYTVQPVEWNDQTVLYPALNALKVNAR